MFATDASNCGRAPQQCCPEVGVVGGGGGGVTRPELRAYSTSHASDGAPAAVRACLSAFGMHGRRVLQVAACLPRPGEPRAGHLQPVHACSYYVLVSSLEIDLPRPARDACHSNYWCPIRVENEGSRASHSLLGCMISWWVHENRSIFHDLDSVAIRRYAYL